MPVLRLWTEQDGLLSAIAPLGLGASAGTVLVVDLDPAGPRYPGEQTLAGLVDGGPSRRHLRPDRRGLAVLANGGIGADEADEIVDAFCDGWPNVVLRVPTPDTREDLAPLVPVVPMMPGALSSTWRRPAVHQRTGLDARPLTPGPVLPRPSRATISALLRGVAVQGSRWIKAWRPVWEMPWV